MRVAHPELEEGEMWIFNLKRNQVGNITYDCLDWETKRKGVVAYTESGHIRRHEYPVFIKISEYKEIVNGIFS